MGIKSSQVLLTKYTSLTDHQQVWLLLKKQIFWQWKVYKAVWFVFQRETLFTSGKYSRQLPVFSGVGIPANLPKGQTAQCSQKVQKNQAACQTQKEKKLMFFQSDKKKNKHLLSKKNGLDVKSCIWKHQCLLCKQDQSRNVWSSCRVKCEAFCLIAKVWLKLGYACKEESVKNHS